MNNKVNGPLHGLKVLDLSRVLAAPWCVQNLGDLGAEVVKVERPGAGDESRHWGPPWFKDANGEATKESAYFMSANRNKRSVAIDFTKPEGQALVREMVLTADICIENFKVGDLARYGLDYASLSALNPRLVYCSVTGFGQDGPWASRPGYDYLFQGLGGLMSVTGERDGAPGAGPQRIGVAIVDMFTGMYATIAILAALRHRDVSGEGQHIDVSLMGSVLALSSGHLSNFMIGGNLPGRTGNVSPTVSPYGVYAGSDGPFIVASANQKQFVALCQVLGHPEWSQDPRFKDNAARIANNPALYQLFAQVMVQQPCAHWEKELTAAGVPAGQINNYAQVMEHPQAKHLQARVELDHALGVKVPVVANPMRFSKTPVTYRRAPPMLGQHTLEVLQEAGLTPEQIAILVEKGAVKTL
jgi:crotonobetainyl-CoA:carnitine CoA-transferase CaiB-like acyl-CoA transferase